MPPESNNEKLTTVKFATVDDLPTGTKKIFEVQGRKILVINDNGQYFAVSGLCSHYNFPLENGVYHNGRIRCPLHGACFNVSTGDIEDYPGFDSLHSFKVTRSDNDLFITYTPTSISTDRRLRMVPMKKVCDAPIVVIGSGPAASSFIEHVRLNGCYTPIKLITEEKHPPYDRVLLSKKPQLRGDQIRLRTDDFYKERDVDVVLETRVTGVDTARRQLKLKNGSTQVYSKLVIATGGHVRKLTVPGHDLENVFYLRQSWEANEIHQKANSKHVVCIGASFIGMEIAGALKPIAKSVTVICTGQEPLPALGVDIGAAIRKRFESKGVRIMRNAKVVSLGGNKTVTEVILADGQKIEADLVVAGIGVVPATEFLTNTPIKTDRRGFVVVDKQFRTSADFVYAIGDVVSAPLPLWNLDTINIQHFQTAQSHGQLLGYSIVGKPLPHPIIPFFWTLFFMEFGVKFAGCAEGSDDIFVRGIVDELNFVKYYFKKDVVVAVAAAGPRPIAIQFLEIFGQGKKIRKNEVLDNDTDDWSKHLIGCSTICID